MEEVKTYESTELKIKSQDLFRTFPHLFKHIKFTDILFFRIDAKRGIALNLIPINQEPWKYLVPYKYILICYEEFDYLPTDMQFTALAHQLLKIPQGYEESNIIRVPDIVMYDEESEIMAWLKDHKFSIMTR